MRHLFLALILAASTVFSVPVHAADLLFAQVASHSNPASATNAKGLSTGIRVYFDKVNANGGVGGNQLKLTTLDDGLQSATMVALTQEVIDARSAIGLLGYLNSSGLAEIAKKDLLGKNGMALIAPLQGDKHVVGARNMFPLRSGYTDEIAALLKEAKGRNKDTVALVHMNIDFGPSLSTQAHLIAGENGVQIVTHQILNAAPNQLEASVKAAVSQITKNEPKAVLILAAGQPAFEFIRSMRAAAGDKIQLYGLSVLLHDVLVKEVGLEAARGIVLSQAVPYPFTPTQPVINEFQADMKQYAPGEAISFSSFEGYLGAKIAVEAVRRAGSQPTRASLLQALTELGEYNLGGVYVNYTPSQRKGWGGVNLSIINASGALRK
jgi:ABC-type branched-subunit amino acid transport system substrate-binding protein